MPRPPLALKTHRNARRCLHKNLLHPHTVRPSPDSKIKPKISLGEEQQLDIAFCIKDDQTWDAKLLRDEAAKQPPTWLEERRQTFICGGCEKKARFINGPKRNPHFGVVRGREHDEDCDFLGDTNGRNNSPGAPLPNRAPAEGNKEIRYAKPGPLNPPPAAGGNGGNTAPANGGNPTAAGQGPLHETTALRTLLKNLRNRPDYPPQDLYLDVPARGPAVRATDYFQKIGELTSETPTDGVTRAYWGYVHNTDDWSTGAEGKKKLWIYCDHIAKTFTIHMDYDVKDELYAAMGIDSSSPLEKGHVIVEGVMRKGAKLSVAVTDISKIAFLPKRKAT